MIAANVPRRAAALVSRSNEISVDVLGADSLYLPERIHFDSREYHERFMATLEGMPRGGMMGRLEPEALYKAQILKDAVMAASLEPFLDRTTPLLLWSLPFRLSPRYTLSTSKEPS